MRITQPHARTVIALSLVAAGALALTGCAPGTADTTDPSDDTTTVSFQLDWVKNSEFAGYFTAESAAAIGKAPR